MKVKYQVLSFEMKKIWKNKTKLFSNIVVPMLLVFMLGFLSYLSSKKDSYFIYTTNTTMEEYELLTSDGKLVYVVPVSVDELKDKINEEDGLGSDIYVDYGNNTIYYCSANSVAENLKFFAKELLVYQKMSETYSDVEIAEKIILHDVANGANIWTKMFATLLPYILIPILYSGVVQTISESISGERERGVFSKTLLAPITMNDLIFGKVIAGVLCGLIEGIAYFGAMGILKIVSKIEGLSSFSVLYGVQVTGFQMCILVGYSIVCSSLFAAIATYLSLVFSDYRKVKLYQMMIQYFIVLLTFSVSLKTGICMEYEYLIPIYNICLVFQDILYGTLEFFDAFACMLMLILCSIVMIILCRKELKNEEVVF